MACRVRARLAANTMPNPGLFLSAAAVPRLSVGLDQAVALPRDSYLQVNFRAVSDCPASRFLCGAGCRAGRPLPRLGRSRHLQEREGWGGVSQPGGAPSHPTYPLAPPTQHSQAYYKDLYASLRVGPPLYFVVRGLNVSDGAGQLDKVCSISGCRKDSLPSRVSSARLAAAFSSAWLCPGHLVGVPPPRARRWRMCATCSHGLQPCSRCKGRVRASHNPAAAGPLPPNPQPPPPPPRQVSEAALAPESSFIASPAASWPDDFLSWLSPALPKCCRRHPPGSPFEPATGGPRCPPPDQQPCAGNASACADCGVCYSELPGGRPPLAGIQEYLPWCAGPGQRGPRPGGGRAVRARRRGQGP
jgi:hypothetical protein